MSIEFLNINNINELICLSEESHKESAWHSYSFNHDVFRKNMMNMIDNTNNFVCLYRKNGKIIGYFGATLGRFLFSPSLFGMENGIYIKPEHRGGRIAFLMFNEFTAWCKRNNAEPFVEIYFTNDIDNEKTYRFFRKVGMVECGRVFRSISNGVP